MWLIYSQAKTFQQSPSDLLGFEHPWVRWQFDQSVFYLGTHVESKLSQHDKDGRPKYTIEEALNLPPRRIDLDKLPAVAGISVVTVKSSQKKEA